MKRLIVTLVAAIWIVGAPSALGQITPEKIAIHCAMDSNGTIEQYREYATALAKTLSGFSPAALDRILGESAVSRGTSPTLNDLLDLGPINFPNNSAALSAGAYQELDKVIAYLNDNPGVKIEIEGHTSSHPIDHPLSESRAISAQLYMAQNGVDIARVTAVGYGDTQPIEGGDKSEQRRIAIVIKN